MLTRLSLLTVGFGVVAILYFSWTGIFPNDPLQSDPQYVDEEWVQKNAQEIKELNDGDPYSLDFSEIAESIGDARIVLLGEQHHGDGSTFFVKNKLVENLHKEKGFDLIAFESGFFELNTIWNKDQDYEEKVDLSRKSLYRIWAKSSQLNPLFNFIKEDGGIEITGFDSRHASKYAKKDYVIMLDSVIRAFSLPIIKEDSYRTFKGVLEKLIAEEYNHAPNDSEKVVFYETLDTIQAQMKNSLNYDDQKGFWVQEIKNLKGNAKSVWIDCDSRVKSINFRDAQMAENLLWLINNKYKDRKIIVWAANFHIARKNKIFTFSSGEGYYETTIPMAGMLFPILEDKMYNIAFVSGYGKYTEFSDNDREIELEVSQESLECYLNKMNYNFGYVDLKSKRGRIEPFNMSGIGHYELEGEWDHIFDGVFYIRNMIPSDLAPADK